VAELHTPLGNGAFRPLWTVWCQLLKALAGENSANWHAAGLGLHLLNSALLFAIAWRLWRDKVSAVVASLVFGLHGTRPEAALWSAAACDLLACACVLGSILLALCWQTGRSRRRLALSLLLVATGILFKESAYAAPLIAFWILWSRWPVTKFRGFLAGSAGVCAALLAWRWHVFHGPGGYIDHATGQPAILSLHPLTAAKAVFLRIWAILLVPVNWDAPLSWWLPLSLAAGTGALVLLASNSQSGNAGTVRTRLCLVAAACCAVLPAIHLASIGQAELGSRILYLAGAPFALLVGSLTLAASRRTVAISLLMLAGMAGILEHNLTAWHATALHARSLCQEAARAPRTLPETPAPGTLDGVYLFQNGLQQCVAAARNTRQGKTG
jgi:hypothetical protein